MGIKKKLGMGVATAVLGLGLIGGGTFAYFSDTAEATGDFAAGTLDLSANPTTIIEVENMKPGDWMTRSFELTNGGSLDIAEINLATDYTVSGEEDNLGVDFGDHIQVNFLWNEDKVDGVIYSATLSELKDMSPDVIEGNILSPWLGERGGQLEAGSSDKLYVQFEFVDNKKDQNIFQGDSLELEWTFEGMQGEGERK
ncbi:SipW-dependent-type signal peptide-containing protein [Virgibacillus sp. NKC19-16]|uniref:TasA family protein n=1 Tax=Virgibacillus salidurans TaxID=2831673 RepID=UPI001F3CFD03|nr:TasA family protein [Virgibacillus sp. NKC19-16]UJL45363.1 SipW-dependent-type signal peptide-containing protein [Virgibacillus sp. NKC19-16]